MDKLAIAIISGIVALIVSIVTSYFAWRTTHRKFRLETEEKYRSRLFELRLDHYPRAFEITGRVVFDPDTESTAEEIDSIQRELRQWWVGPAAALLSEESVAAYYQYEKAMKAARSRRSGFQGEGKRRVFSATQELRRCLKNDLGLPKSPAPASP